MACGLRLDSLELTNFHKFEHYSIDFNSSMTVLVGENGSGKSSILDAACSALGLYIQHFSSSFDRRLSTFDARISRFEVGGVTDWQEQYPVTVSATGVIGDEQDKPISWDRVLYSNEDSPFKVKLDEMGQYARGCVRRMQDGDKDLVLPVIAFYGTNRLWAQERSQSMQPVSISRKDGYRGALDSGANESQLLAWFYKMTAQDVQRSQSLKPTEPSPLFAAVRGAVEECFKRIAGCEEVRVAYNLDVNDLDVEYIDETGNVQRLPMGRLSDGYRTTLSMVADIAYRMAVLNPALGEEVFTTPGVVLIDEVDLHLHPLWQARILGDLRSLFPNVQFIVTTHAPMVISSVPGSQIRILGEEGASAPEHESFGLGANDVLTGIMGASDRQPEIQNLFSKFGRLMDADQYDEAERLLDELEEKTGSSNPDVVAARSMLAFERL